MRWLDSVGWEVVGQSGLGGSLTSVMVWEVDGQCVLEGVSTVMVGRWLDSVRVWEEVGQCGLGGGQCRLGGGWTVWVGRWLDSVGWEVFGQ